MGFELAPDYKDVPTRIADFKLKHPEGCLRPANPEQPYDVVTIGQQFFIVYTAAAYRNPEDTLPGIGVAWEPFPGKTPYTKDSELQNAETSAWGRAIVAVLASESKSVASAEDVRNRQADADVKPVSRHTTPDGELIEVWAGEHWVIDAKAQVVEACVDRAGTRHAAARSGGVERRDRVHRLQRGRLGHGDRPDPRSRVRGQLRGGREDVMTEYVRIGNRWYPKPPPNWKSSETRVEVVISVVVTTQREPEQLRRLVQEMVEANTNFLPGEVTYESRVVG